MLKIDEIEHQNKFWINREQQWEKDTEKFKISKEKLNFQEKVEEFLCKGPIVGSYLAFIPPDSNQINISSP